MIREGNHSSIDRDDHSWPPGHPWGHVGPSGANVCGDG